MLIQNIISFDQFKQYMQNYKYVIVNIGASWCKPCNLIKPHIEKFISVMDEIEYIYLKIDNSIFDEDIEFEKFFHLGKIPYFAFIKNGNIIDHFVSGDFNIVSKRIFDHIINERNDLKFNDNF